MFHTNRDNGSDKSYRVEPLEARRMLSVSDGDAETPVEQPSETTEYTEELYDTTFDETQIYTCGFAETPGEEIGGEGEYDAEILTFGGDDPSIMQMSGAPVSAQSGAADTSNSPPPEQSAGFIKAADTSAVAKSVLGSSGNSVLN